MNRMMIAMMLMLGAPAFAQSAEAPRAESCRHDKGERISSKLGLDAATTAKVEALFGKYQVQIAPLRKQGFETRAALEQALAVAHPDDRLVVQLTDQIGRVHQQLQALRLGQQTELKQLLTPAQYGQLMLSRHGRHHEGRRHGKGPRRDAR